MIAALRQRLDEDAAQEADRALAAAARADLDAARERCSTLHGFVREAWKILEPTTTFVDGWAIAAICQHLEAVSDGRITRLLINIPPGMMKSLLTSVFFPAYEWGPADKGFLRYVSTSFSMDNVLRDNVKMRRLIESEWYQALWGDRVKMTPDQNAKGSFDNTQMGGRVGVPFSNMTGKRGDRLIIDDPHSTTSAESPQQRGETVKMFREGASDRLNDIERSAIIVIMQRLHTDDVSGEILKLKLPYVHLNLPMEFESDRRCVTEIGFEDPRTYDGELLAPGRFPQSAVESLKIVKGPYAYAGQYQQRPAPREGGLFDVDAIEIVDAIPIAYRKRVRAWDFAATEPKKNGGDPDWTAHVLMSRGDDGFIYIEDADHFRKKGHEVKRMLVEKARADGGDVYVRFPQDPGQAGKDQAEDRARALAGFMFRFERPTGAKTDRAEPFANQVGAGNVKMLRGPWNAALLDELRNFPMHGHDDFVDAAADAFNEIAGVKPGENLVEYYRQEAEKVRAKLDNREAPVGLGDMVVMKGPVSMVYGLRGKEYRPDDRGYFHLHPEDASSFYGQIGWEIISTPGAS